MLRNGFLTIYNPNSVFSLSMDEVAFEMRDVEYKQGEDVVSSRAHSITFQDTAVNTSLEGTVYQAEDYC